MPPLFSARHASLLALVVQNVSLVIMIRYTKVANSGYTTSTVVVVAECIKLVFNITLEVYNSLEGESGFLDIGNMLAKMKSSCFSDDALKLAIPGLLYTIQNNLAFFALRHLSVPVFQVSSQGKILATALWSRLLMGRSFSKRQVLSLFLLTGGIALVQLSGSHHGRKGDDPVANSGVKGFAAVVVSCFTSSFAGVYFEKILKHTQSNTCSVYVRNTQLACWSLLLGLVPVVTRDFKAILEEGFFHGYTLMVVLTTFNHALGGLLVSMVIKHADNVEKNFATSLSILLGSAISVCLLGFVLEVKFVAGAALVVLSIFLFSGKFSGMALWGKKCRSFYCLPLIMAALYQAPLSKEHFFNVKTLHNSTTGGKSVLSKSFVPGGRNCAVIYTSSSLLKHEDGPTIDLFDEVFRFNKAQTKGLEIYVGSKTTVRVVQFCCHTAFDVSPGVWFAKQNETGVQGLTFPFTEQEIRGYNTLHSRVASEWSLVPKSFLEDCIGLLGLRQGQWCSIGILTAIWAMNKCSTVTVFGTYHFPCLQYDSDQPFKENCTVTEVFNQYNIELEKKKLEQWHLKGKIILKDS